MIAFVISGMEHSGTTLVSDLFRQIPGVDAGLETGVLLSATPRRFVDEKPFSDWIGDCWGITEDELAACCETDDFPVFYERLAKASRAIVPGTHTIFDKTPRYLATLASCLAKVDVPFIVTCKDPRAIVHSDHVRAGRPDFGPWFEHYADAKLGYMQQAYDAYTGPAGADARVLRMSLERLCLRPRDSCEAMFAHVGQVFSLRYLLLKGLRYGHTRDTTISPRIPFEYLDAFSAAQCTLISRRFASLDDWFYE